MLGFRQWCVRGEEKNELFLILKQGNVVMFGATSRRYKEGISQRRDVRSNVATVQRMAINDVATLQRVGLNNVATLRNNVATFQRLIKIHVVTLITHVATF